MRSVEGRCGGRYVAEGEARAVAEWLIAEVREQYREDLDRIGDELERVTCERDEALLALGSQS